MITSAWRQLDPDVEAWIEDYDRRSASETAPKATELFAGTFLVLDPAHAVALTPAELAAALPRRRAMFDAAGVGAIRRTGSSQLRLDDRHLLVSVDWSAERTDRDPVRLESTFLVRREPEGLRIVVYLNHRDVAALLST